MTFTCFYFFLRHVKIRIITRGKKSKYEILIILSKDLLTS